MRTTVNLDGHLLEQAKQRAAERNLTLGQYLEEAIRRDLTEPRRARRPVSLPVFRGGGGVRPGVELSTKGLYDALDAEGVFK